MTYLRTLQEIFPEESKDRNHINRMKTDFSYTKFWGMQQTLWQNPGLVHLTAKCIGSSHMPSVGSLLLPILQSFLI